ncbi:unnamed protein product [Aphanomyces euteiches]
MLRSTLFLLCGVGCHAQYAGSLTPEVHPPLPSQTCTAAGCTTQNTKIVLDSNWRWLHNVGGTVNCYLGNLWNPALCPDPLTCAKNCAMEGADYAGTYGIKTSGSQVSLKFVTRNNVGTRIYLLQDDDKYMMFKLLNQEFTFDVDVSQLPCGLISALYFSQMDQDGGMSRFPINLAGAAYGTGYCDAQCPHDVKFINGEANVNNWTPSKTDPNGGSGQYGSCCAEMDIWESNTISQAYTSHPCTVTEPTRCTSASECGDDATDNRYDGVCDKDGCDFNPWRLNNHNFYGPGSKFAVDSTKPITVVTQFITDDATADGNLVDIKRFYLQNGKVIENIATDWKGIDRVSSLTDSMCGQIKTVFDNPDDHAKKGGLKAMGETLKKGVVLAMSLWADHAAHGLWLDSSFPVEKNSSLPGVSRGSCPKDGGVPAELQTLVPNATVTFSNIRVGDLGTTTANSLRSPTPSPPQSSSTPSSSPLSPPPKPSTSGSPGVQIYSQCGGLNYKGPTECQDGLVCIHMSDDFDQCLALASPRPRS